MINVHIKNKLIPKKTLNRVQTMFVENINKSILGGVPEIYIQSAPNNSNETHTHDLNHDLTFSAHIL